VEIGQASSPKCTPKKAVQWLPCTELTGSTEGTTSAGPLAAVGIATFDGTGGVSAARQTIRKNGVTTSDLFTTPAGVRPYQVDSDCGLRLLNPDGSVLGHGVVINGGKELFILSLSDANSVYGVMKKIDAD
jgi:hypothetical protein